MCVRVRTHTKAPTLSKSNDIIVFKHENELGWLPKKKGAEDCMRNVPPATTTEATSKEPRKRKVNRGN